MSHISVLAVCAFECGWKAFFFAGQPSAAFSLQQANELALSPEVS